MKRKLLAFDLDGTLAPSKSPISGAMATTIGDVLRLYEVCVISGGAFPQFETQLVNQLQRSSALPPELLLRLHLLPTSGTRCYQYDAESGQWVMRYSNDLTPDEIHQATDALTTSAQQQGIWTDTPHGPIIENRGSQITYSALGQEAPLHLKHGWDVSGAKREALRDAVAKLLPDLEVRAGGSTSIDITRRGIDKAYGIGRIVSMLNLQREDVLFFGDRLQPGGNDYPVRAMGIDSIEVRDELDTLNALLAIVATSCA
jgi:phosphomannomutase